MRQIVRFEAKAQLAWRAARTGAGPWVGICDALRLTVEGDTWGELETIIAEVLDDLFRDLFRTGELERFLSDLGWIPISPLPQAMPDEGLVFDVPTRVVAVAADALH